MRMIDLVQTKKYDEISALYEDSERKLVGTRIKSRQMNQGRRIERENENNSIEEQRRIFWGF